MGLLIIFIIFAPGKGNVNPITVTTTPRKHEGYPTPSLGGGGGGGGGGVIQGKFGLGWTPPKACNPALCLTFSAPNIQVQVLQTDLHKFPLIVS